MKRPGGWSEVGNSCSLLVSNLTDVTFTSFECPVPLDFKYQVNFFLWRGPEECSVLENDIMMSVY